MSQRKRSHDEIEQAEVTEDKSKPDEATNKNSTIKNSPEEGWQVAESRSSKRRKKLPRKESDKYPSITHSAHARLQSVVKLSDLQNLVLYLLADGTGPQWCSVQHHANVRKVVVLMVPGLEMGMFDDSVMLSSNGEKSEQSKALKHDETTTSATRKAFISPDDFYPKKLKQDRMQTALKPLPDIFEHVWPVKTPGDDRFAKMHSPLASLLNAPIQKPKEEKNGKGPNAPREAGNWKSNRTVITEYIATTEELLAEGYVLHPAHFSEDEAVEYHKTREANNTLTGWIDTSNIKALSDGEVSSANIEKGAITAGRNILAIDCEMCITSPVGVQPQIYSLTRMSVIDWDNNVVLDELVKPEEPITNYLTPYSGITAEMLKDVTTTLEQAREKLISKITPQTILIGHSLDSDLRALRLTHPFIIDTSLLYPHPRGPPLKSSLKWLAQKYLSRNIQAGHGSTGHNSIEDAIASLDLVKQKCEKGKSWGTSEASQESVFYRLGRAIRPKRYKLHPDGENEHRTGAVVDWGEPKRGFGGQAAATVACTTDSDVVNGVKAAVTGTADMPIGGVDFIWARFRELEAYRGWWRSSKSLDVDALRESAIYTNADSLLGDVVSKTVGRIVDIWQSLPPCTAFIVYSGSGDPRRLAEMSEIKQKHKAEYAVKKWDELSIRWTDTEEQELKKACETARRGIAFMTVK